MVDVHYDGGVFLPGPGLWLDPRAPQPFAFISHAHSDHTALHQRTLCTPVTAQLMALRMSVSEELTTLDYGEKKSFGSWSATLLPAGHILGSAQILVESAEGRLLYTGDFKLRPGLSCSPAEARRAETLIIETTYGLPKYIFPPAEETIAQIKKFCIESLEDGDIPVLLGYSLGKAQEILAALAGVGLPVMLHGSVAKITRGYQQAGVRFPEWQPYDAAAVVGHVLICPPSVNGSRMLTSIKNRRTAVITGWALDANIRHRLRVDAAFPLSDHADYGELLQHVENVRPRRVLTLHGFAREFARDLRARGIEAWALTAPDQLELTLSLPVAAKPAPQKSATLTDAAFNRFALVCEQIRQTTGKLKKTEILSTYLRSLDDIDLPLAATWLTGRVFPQSSDTPLQVGYAVIRESLARITGLSTPEMRAIGRKHNDLGLSTEEIMSRRPGDEALSLADLGKLFQYLNAARGPLAKTELLVETLRRLPALTAGYLVRIITGDLRIGLKEGLLEDAVAQAFASEPAAIREANMLLGDIGKTAQLARAGRLEEAALRVFHPVKCMLASPEPDAESVWSRLGTTGTVWLEHKLDGIRAQIHCAPGKAEIFSRDLKRITETFPEIATAARALNREAIFDGEILAWEAGRALSFFELQKRLGRRGEDLFMGAQVPVAFLAFDLLLLDGATFLKSPLTERRRLLETLKLPLNFQLATVHTATNPDEIESGFTHARESGNEGLMAKDPASLYLPGRRGLAWIKLKKAFATLDVVVTAAEYGHGRRSKVLSDYTFAIRHDSTGELLTIGKAYSGLTDAEIADLTKEFLRVTIGRKGNRLEVDPRVIIEVAFDSIQPSTRHASGLALRFPRIKRLRHDKTVAEIDTLSTAQKLVKKA